MVRGPKKHMKRLNAPSHWMLNKLGGVFVSPSLEASENLLRSYLPASVLSSTLD